MDLIRPEGALPYRATVVLPAAGKMAAPFVSGKGIVTWYGLAASGPALVYGLPPAIMGSAAWMAAHPVETYLLIQYGPTLVDYLLKQNHH